MLFAEMSCNIRCANCLWLERRDYFSCQIHMLYVHCLLEQCSTNIPFLMARICRKWVLHAKSSCLRRKMGELHSTFCYQDWTWVARRFCGKVSSGDCQVCLYNFGFVLFFYNDLCGGEGKYTAAVPVLVPVLRGGRNCCRDAAALCRLCDIHRI